MSAPDPQAIRLARASWDAATPGTRALMFLRCRYAGRRAVDLDAGEVPFLTWEYLPAEIASELAWDVQFLSRVLRDGHAALKAATTFVVDSERVAA